MTFDHREVSAHGAVTCGMQFFAADGRVEG